MITVDVELIEGRERLTSQWQFKKGRRRVKIQLKRSRWQAIHVNININIKWRRFTALETAITNNQSFQIGWTLSHIDIKYNTRLEGRITNLDRMKRRHVVDNQSNTVLKRIRSDKEGLKRRQVVQSQFSQFIHCIRSNRQFLQMNELIEGEGL